MCEGFANSSGRNIVETLDASYYKGQGFRQGTEREYLVFTERGAELETIVRRLTPLECSRLQGFPEKVDEDGKIIGWVDIGDWVDTQGKVHKEADTPKYKALGNSIAVGYANNQSGFWMVLMKRISAQYERSATLGSLFSGIGGFELAHVRFNGSDSVLWSSEIEEFPIAVLKKHFGDEDAGLKGDIQQYL